ncbi:MAG: helix-turn-helix transcriptional regulator [Solirubrobacteraceae bacterium]
MIAASLEKRVLSLVGELLGLQDLDEFCRALLVTIRQEFGADYCALHELPADLPDTISLTDPETSQDQHEAFARYAHQNPIVDYFLRTRDGRATRFSDLVSQGELHRLELYKEVYRNLGVEYQIALTLPSGADWILGLALSRREHDFSDRERDLLDMARPYLIQIYRNALAVSRGYHTPDAIMSAGKLEPLGLTKRQAELLALLATGYTATRAAAALGITARTAQKHVERCYRALGVTNRGDACRLAWATVGV